MITIEAIGKRIQKAREEKNISQQQLADSLKDMGINVSRETISKIENGSRTISVIEVNAICKTLDINLDELLENEKEEENLVTLFRKMGRTTDVIDDEIIEIQEGLKGFILQKGLYNGDITIKKRIPVWEEKISG